MPITLRHPGRLIIVWGKGTPLGDCAPRITGCLGKKQNDLHPRPLTSGKAGTGIPRRSTSVDVFTQSSTTPNCHRRTICMKIKLMSCMVHRWLVWTRVEVLQMTKPVFPDLWFTMASGSLYKHSADTPCTVYRRSHSSIPKSTKYIAFRPSTYNHLLSNYRVVSTYLGYQRVHLPTDCPPSFRGWK